MLDTNTIEEPVDRVTNFFVDEEGFLLDSEQWSEAFAASVLGLLPHSLSASHKDVLYYVRNKYLNLGALPPTRHVCKSIGVEKSELKVLFGSCIQLWRAAGLPAPDDEVRAYMN